MKKGSKPAPPPTLDGQAVISDVLARTRADVQAATTARVEQNRKLESAGKRLRPKGNEKLSFAIYFAKHMGNAIAAGLRSDFPTVRSGETPSMSVRGPKRVPCPREGPPKEVLSLSDFLKRVTSTYDRRNGRDFHFEGEGPE